jgi:hypothetical protein
LAFSFLLDWVIGFLGFALLAVTIVEGYFDRIGRDRLPPSTIRAGRPVLSFWLRPRQLFLINLGSCGWKCPFQRLVIRAFPAPALYYRGRPSRRPSVSTREYAGGP